MNKFKIIPGKKARVKEDLDSVFAGMFALISANNPDSGTVTLAFDPALIPIKERGKYHANVNGYVPVTFAEEEIEVFGDSPGLY